MTRDDAPDRIWIEEDDGCPYFYDASELAEAGGPLIEYIRADLAAPAPVGREFGAELSGNTGGLIDKMAEAIRGDTTSDDTPWAVLSEDRKIGWRGDAERALAAVKEYLTAHSPAPVVPAEGPISTLEMVYRNMPDIPELPEAYQPRNIARSLAALRSAPPVGARVRPWETRPADPDAMIPATVEVHRGAWAVVIGTNGKPAGWIDTHDLFANQLYRDHILTTPAALLPAGEGEE